MLRDAPHQGDGVQGSSHDQLLSGLQPQPNPDGDFRQAIEKLGMGGGLGRVPELFVHDLGLSKLKRGWLERLHGSAAGATSMGKNLTDAAT
jgi:hypothetical protein